MIVVVALESTEQSCAKHAEVLDNISMIYLLTMRAGTREIIHERLSQSEFYDILVGARP